MSRSSFPGRKPKEIELSQFALSARCLDHLNEMAERALGFLEDLLASPTATTAEKLKACELVFKRVLPESIFVRLFERHYQLGRILANPEISSDLTNGTRVEFVLRQLEMPMVEETLSDSFDDSIS